jgi:hypothetical protein
LKRLFLAFACLCCQVAWGQDRQSSVADYLGPGVLSRGAREIGRRAGQDVDLRLYAGASAVYDNGLNPVSVDERGSLVRVGGIFGVEVNLGLYGKKNFRRGMLGIDYQSFYRHYIENPFYSGTNQQLTVGYTWQKSRRIVFDFRQSASTTPFASSLALGLPTAGPVDQTSLLFDNRTDALQSSVDMTYIASQRTSYTIGGDWTGIFRRSKALVGVRGYSLRGHMQHRTSARTTLGVSYQHSHYDFPGLFGGSDMDMFSGFYSRQFGRAWILSLSAGVYHSQVEGVTRVNLDPLFAALLGIQQVSVPFYASNYVPYGGVGLTRSFRNAVWNVNYQRSIMPGNGVYLTSRQESAASTFSYTGIRRWSLSANVSYSSLRTLGQGLAPYTVVSGGGDVAFRITDFLQIGGGYLARHQEVNLTTFRRNSSRTVVSIYFSPGNVPISFR